MQIFFTENGLTLSVEGNTDSVIILSGFTSSICVLNDAVFEALQPQNNLTLYIGSMLCFTFILAVASFIYSRLYSELEAECKKYKGIVKYLWIGIAISERYVIVSNVPVALRCTIVLFAVQTVVYFIINVSYKKAVFCKVYQSNERL